MSSALIDVALALSLCFAAVAALSTAVLELWARVFASRAGRWSEAMAGAYGSSDFVRLVSRGVVGAGIPAETERSAWGWLRGHEPRISGVEAGRFVNIALAQLDKAGFFTGAPAAPWLEALRGNPAALKAELTRRFEATETQTSNAFKRRSFVASLVFSFLVAWAVNVDALAIAERTYDAARVGARTIVTVPADAPKDSGATTLSDLTGLLDRIRDPKCRADWPGWAMEVESWAAIPSIRLCSIFDLTALFGWLLTALFATPGAKFWYDIAASLTRYRAAGK